MSSRIPILVLLVTAWIFQTTTPIQAAKGKRVSRSYQIGQILGTMKQSAKPEETKTDGKPPEEKLIELIVSTVQPGSWRQDGGRGQISYEPVSKSLVIHQTSGAHDEIAELLAALARQMDLQVVLQLHLLTVSEECMERLGVEFEPVKPVPSDNDNPVIPPLTKAFLTDLQVRQLFETAQGDRRSTIMQAPRLTMLNGQAGTVNVMSTQYYLTGLKMECQGDQVIVKPNQEAINLGTSFTVVPTVSADRKSVLVNLKFKQTELASEPAPMIPVQFPMKQEKAKPELFTMFLQQPQINTLAIENTSVIPEGQTLVLCGNKTLVEGRTESGPPIFGKIPYLNRFFRTVGYGRETVSLVIMVTPRIIVKEEEIPRP